VTFFFKRMKLILVVEGTWFTVQKLCRTIDIETDNEYDKISSKAMVMMMNYLLPEDNMAIQDCNTAWAMWVFLQKKYLISTSSISKASIYIAKIVRFHEDIKFGPTAGVEQA
jgi:hypothetical protein